MSFISSRPTGAGGTDLRSQIAPWVTHAIDPDLALPNPWIAAVLVPPGEPVDEREWIRIERNAAISGALRARKARLLGDGVVLETGQGDGSEELFDWWSWVLEELPLESILDIAFRVIWRGWVPFEVVATDRVRDGRKYFVPSQMRDALSWHFRWTGRGDLVFCPGIALPKGYRMDLLPGQLKWWTPRAGSISNPYGYPMHADYMSKAWAFGELSDAGFVQIKQSMGFLHITHRFALADALSGGDVAKLEQIKADVLKMLAELQASGILFGPADLEVKWVELISAIDKWVNFFRWSDDVARAFYQGGNLSTMVSGSTGSLAAGEVQERQGLALAAVDAGILESQFRSGFLRPWSARNAATIAPQAFPGTGPVPSLDDVDLEAVPRLSFKALHKIRQEDIDIVRTFAEIGVIDTGQESNGQSEDNIEDSPKSRLARIDVEHHLRLARWRLLSEEQDGATLDLSRNRQLAGGLPAVARGRGGEEVGTPDEEPEPAEDDNAPG